MEKKLKVLLLGYHDSKLTGHIQYEYLNMPDYVEAFMVTYLGYYGKKKYNFHRQLQSPYAATIHSKLEKLYKQIYSLLFLHCAPVVDDKYKASAFVDFEFYPVSAKQILRKCPKNFIPDIISIHWDRGFANPRVVRELYELTGAKIVYHFVDEAPLTGGCHYPVNCNKYLNGCKSCPALKKGKRLAEKQYAFKIKNLSGLPLYVCGTPFDMRLASHSPLFKDAVKLSVIHKPAVNRVSQVEARRLYGINEDCFVVFVGANSLNNPRKGMYYLTKAIENASSSITNLLVLSAGRSQLNIPGVNIKNLGCLDIQQLMTCFCAADCFVSTTIADSGPMMVNYSIALGVPVVSFPIGVADDLVIHKTTGYLAKYKDVEDVSNGILYIYGLDDNEKKLMSDNCVRIINEHCTKGTWVDLLKAHGNEQKGK